MNTFVHQRVHSTDIVEHANALPGWQQCYDQLSPGRLDGWLNLTLLDEVQVFRERLNRAVVQTLHLPKATVNILVPLAWPRLDEQCAIHAGQATVLPAVESLRVVSPAGMDVLCLSIPLTTLADVLDEPVLAELRRLSVLRSIAVPAGQLAADCGPLLALFDMQLLATRQIAELKAALVLLAAGWLEHLVSEPDTLPGPGTRRYIVERCHQWLLEPSPQPPSVIEMCRRLKISRRTLQYSFQSVAAVSPVQYLRSVRLNAARRSMRQSPLAGISEIAALWGFEHASYFSLEYQKLFGELPSAARWTRATITRREQR